MEAELEKLQKYLGPLYPSVYEDEALEVSVTNATGIVNVFYVTWEHDDYVIVSQDNTVMANYSDVAEVKKWLERLGDFPPA